MNYTCAMLVAVLALSGCTSVPQQVLLPPAPAGSNGWQTIGETSDFGPQITPIKVVEDSRCPTETVCARGGKIKVLTRISLANGTRVRDEVLSVNERLAVADGTVALSAVYPPRTAERDIPPSTYRFAYRFDGGL